MSKQKAKGSFRDREGKLFVDCAECNWGGNSFPEKDRCAGGGQIKKPGTGHGCFNGELLDYIELIN